MQTLRIGPPVSIFGGMNNDYRRQQLPPNFFRTLRNVEVDGESLVRRDGVVRLVSGAFPNTCLQTDGQAGTYLTVPQLDVADILDYDLGNRWSIFVSYVPRVLNADCLLIQDGTIELSWVIKHKANGMIEAIVKDAGSSTVTLQKAGMNRLEKEHQILLVRNGADLSLYVNNHAPVTSSALDPNTDTMASTANIYIGGPPGVPSGVFDIMEVRIMTVADTSDTWRYTQYPWTSKFGDPNLVLHLLFEEGSGTTISDFSRNANAGITLTGGWSWQGSSVRQTIAPVTGLFLMEDKAGRRFLLADIGVNHYRIVL